MQVKKNLAFQIISGEAFIVDSEKSMLHNLNETGTLIWKNLLKGKEKKEIISNMLKNFNVSEKEAKKDYLNFLKELKSKNLLEEE